MSCGFFVTGTDTGVGKTLITCALLRGLAARGLRVAGMKPVAAGCDERGGRLVSADADAIRAAGNVALADGVRNPYRFREPIAPHIAAGHDGVHIDIARIVEAFSGIAADCVLVEGVGGFRVPLSATEDGADLARALALPVILVVGMRLGCLNHALLTRDAILIAGLEMAGWVANRLDPGMAEFEANVEALRTRLPGKLLGVIPYLSAATTDEAAPFLDPEPLIRITGAE